MGSCLCQDPDAKVNPGECWRRRKRQVILHRFQKCLGILGKQGQWNRAWSWRKSPMIGCPGRIKYHITLRKVTSCFLWSDEERGVDRVRSAGCRQRRWPGVSSSFSVCLLRLSTWVGPLWHTPIKTHLRGGAAILFPTSVSLLLFCHSH